jgi:hypothetical protein
MKPRTKGRTPPYLWPLLVVLGYGAFLLWFFDWKTLAEAFADNLKKPDWWVSDTLSFVLFGLFVGWVTSRFQQARLHKEREPYENWKVVVKDEGQAREAMLFRDEVRRFMESPLEERRMIQSVVSVSGGWLDTRKLDLVPDCNWVERNDEKREYVIDMEEFRDSEDCRRVKKENLVQKAP